MKVIGLLAVLAITLINISEGTHLRSEGKTVCKPGSVWGIPCGMTCRCSPQGIPMCHKAPCLRAEEPPKESRVLCKPGTVTTPDSCNICRCGHNGLNVCTLKLCPSLKTHKY